MSVRVYVLFSERMGGCTEEIAGLNWNHLCRGICVSGQGFV